MRKRIEKSPVLITILLFIIAVLLGAVLSAILLPSDINTGASIGRIIVAILYFVLFIRCFNLKNSFKGFLLILPLALMGLYQIPLVFITEGGTINPLTVPLLLSGFAPGFFEEVLFRGILIYGLKRKYNDPKKIVLISTLVFALVHVTNIVGIPLVSIIIQVLFAFAGGAVFGAVYLITEDLVSVILMHSFIDIIARTFQSGETDSLVIIGLFVLLLIAETIYGFYLTKKA